MTFPDTVRPRGLYPREVEAENADQSWAVMLAFVAEHGDSLEAAALVEDFIDQHADAFAPRIEEQAWKDPSFAALVANAHLGDISGPGVGRVARLQDALFERGDVGTRWRGWMPLAPDQIPRDDS